MSLNQHPSPQAPRRQTILVAEDDSSLLSLIQTFLQRDGYEVLAAADGKQTFELFKAHGDRVALALLDMNMPVMNGVECLFAMKKLKPGFKVLFLTGRPEELSADDIGNPVGVLLKPVQRAALLDEIRKAIAAPHAA